MYLETAEITVTDPAGFEAAVAKARPRFLAADGCLGLSLHRVVETPDIYRLLVKWRSVEDHGDFPRLRRVPEVASPGLALLFWTTWRHAFGCGLSWLTDTTKAAAMISLPPRACDSHVHVFQPDRFAEADDRNYTPGTADCAALRAHLASLGLSRCFIVQPSVHGTDIGTSPFGCWQSRC